MTDSITVIDCGDIPKSLYAALSTLRAVSPVHITIRCATPDLLTTQRGLWPDAADVWEVA